MKVTITPIGARESELVVAAARVADYLMGPPSRSGGGGAVRYYSDSAEGAGWWGGRGAVRRGLNGVVGREDLAALLAGRDPVSGERVVSASGSSGRRALRAGEATREVDGVWVWGLEDLVSRFDVDRASVLDAVEVMGEEGVVCDGDGLRWLNEDGVEAIAGHLGVRVAEELSLDGDPDEFLGVGQCAQITCLSPQYLRRALERSQSEQVAGEDPKAYLAGERVGRRWRVRRSELAAFVERRKPPAVRVGYDAVITPEKSMSLLTMLGSDSIRRDCVQALVAANNKALGWLEDHAAMGRYKGTAVGSEGLVVGSFLHGSSRNLDPHPHIHNLIVNAIEDRYGQSRTLDGRGLYREAKSASAVATAEMRWQLCQLGVDFVQHRGGTWELAGVDEETITAFSSRRSEIDAALGELLGDPGDATRNEIQAASVATRGPKVSADPVELGERWQRTAGEVGFDVGFVTGRADRSCVASRSLSRAEEAELWRFLADHADGACSGESTFNRGDALAAINRWAPSGRLRVMPAETVVSACERFLASERAIPLLGGSEVIRRRDGRPSAMVEQRWTTPSMIRRQVVIDALWADGHQAGEAIAPRLLVDEVCSSVGLSDEQADLVRMWTRSGHRFQAAVGRPGTGKTFTMKAAAQVWVAAGFAVMGAAVKGSAAQTLAGEAGIGVETVAWHLHRWREGAPVVDARTVLIVDEASTVPDRDLGELMAMCVQTGAVLRLIGDPAQQRSVGAGGMWEAMLERHSVWTPELVDQRRLQDQDQVLAAEQIRDGNVAEAFKTLRENGQLVVSDEDIHVLAVRRWMQRRERGETSPMVDRRNDTRQVLNEIAQLVRVGVGEVPEPVQVGSRFFGIGDEVVATAPNRDVRNEESGMYVANGVRGVVTSIGGDVVGVDFAGVGEVILANEWCGTNLDLGYAVTAYGIQGATVDEISSIVRPGADLAGLYVSLTRGRSNNELLIAGNDPYEFGSPAAGDVVDLVAESVDDRVSVPAVVSDPGLVEPGLGGGSRVGRGSGGARGRVARAQLGRVRRLGIAEPDVLVVSSLVPRPDVPWLAKDWDAVVGSIAEFRWRWSPQPVGSEVWGSILGRRQGSERAEDWDRVRSELGELSVAVAMRWLKDRAGPKRGYDAVTIRAGEANAFALGLAKQRSARTPNPPDMGTVWVQTGYKLGSVRVQNGSEGAGQQLLDLRTDQALGLVAGNSSRLREQALRDEPEWLICYLTQAAERGDLATVDPDALATWVGDVAILREHHNVRGTELLDSQTAATLSGRELIAHAPTKSTKTRSNLKALSR